MLRRERLQPLRRISSYNAANATSGDASFKPRFERGTSNIQLAELLVQRHVAKEIINEPRALVSETALGRSHCGPPRITVRVQAPVRGDCGRLKRADGVSNMRRELRASGDRHKPALRTVAISRRAFARNGEVRLFKEGKSAANVGRWLIRAQKPFAHITISLYAVRMQAELILRALADTTRLRIMRMIGAMELAVGEIAQVMGQSQPRVSRHVAILCDAGLAERRREGSWIFLRTVTGPPGGFLSAVRRALELAEADDEHLRSLCEGDRQKLAAIRTAREAQAQDYFAAHAESWDELRRLHSADALVEEALVAALGDEPLGQLLDVGTGTGRIAEIFATRAARVVALDKSPAMLRLARARLQHLGGERVEMIQGDFTSLPLPAASMDTVLFHQVLHFAQNPAEALREAARVTRPGGRVAIVDFSAHRREELRERFAHVRLGFTDVQMESLLREAGYKPASSVALEGGELVVKIWIAERLPAARKAA